MATEAREPYIPRHAQEARELGRMIDPDIAERVALLGGSHHENLRTTAILAIAHDLAIIQRTLGVLAVSLDRVADALKP